MRKLSLFSGIGGIDLAAHWAGMETVAFCEREPFPQKVLKKHWPDVPIYDDVCTLTADRLKEDGIIGPGRTIDIISGGYPCQPFSHAGKRQGKEDDRHLWPEVYRLLQEIRPRWFVGENVAGHVTLGLDDVLSDLGDIGYTAQPFVIPSSAVGAPHRRDRVFIVAYSESEQNWRLQQRRVQSDIGTISKDVADSNSEPRLEANQTACTIRSEWDSRDNASRSGRPPTTQRSGRSIESELGGDSYGISTELDGGGLNGSPTKDRPVKALRELQENHVSESIQREIGRPGSIPEKEVLQSSVCRCCADTGETGIVSGEKKGIEIQGDCLRELRGKEESSVPSLGREPIQQYTGKYYDPMQFMPYKMALEKWEKDRSINPLDSLSDWLDRHKWPAGQGAEQFDWEPPRVATGVKDRVGRLKALGNAVNPVQIYPILAAIKAIDDKVHKAEGPQCD